MLFHAESGRAYLLAYIPSDLSSSSSRWGATVHVLWGTLVNSILYTFIVSNIRARVDDERGSTKISAGR